MYHLLLCLLLITGCAHNNSKKDDDDEVSVLAALNQAQSSYLKGCVEAFRSLNIGPTFDSCLEKAKGHRLELEGIMNYNVDEIP